MIEANPHVGAWQETLRQARADVAACRPVRAHGRLTRAVGLVLEAVGLRLAVGSDCLVELPPGFAQPTAEAEVVGFSGDRLYLMPRSEVAGLLPGARVYPLEDADGPPGQGSTKRLPVGEGMLGRVVDATGRPLDGLGPLAATRQVTLGAAPINPLTRAPIEHVLDTGVRAINAMLTVGRGQRMGLFAGSGVGKSVLLGMMARYTTRRRHRGRPDRRARPRGQGVHRAHARAPRAWRAPCWSRRRRTLRRCCACRARPTPRAWPSTSATRARTCC